jgi:predicted DNA-binding WGR domain protein
MTIYLKRHDPQKNMARYYRLIVAQTLFGEWALIAEWGRIGSPGRIQQHWFDSRQEAETVQALRAKRKVRRGYSEFLL